MRASVFFQMVLALFCAFTPARMRLLGYGFSWLAACAAMRSVGGLVFVLLGVGFSAHAQSHSQFFDYVGLNTYWNGTNWTSYATGYGNMFTTNTSTGDYTLYSTGNAASAGLARTLTPVMAVTAAGTVSATRFVGDGSGLTGTTATVSSGASGSLVYRDGSGNLVASSGLSISSTTGSVGIGGGAPASVGNNGLYAAGSMYASGAITSGGGSFVASTGSFFAANNNGLRWQSGNNQIVGDASNQYIAFTTSGTEAMRIVSSGYVGIGTSNPSQKLEVNGNMRVAGGINAGGGGNAWFTATNLGNLNWGVGFLFYTTSSTGVSNLNQLYLAATNNVGVNTTTPTAPLEVSGTVSATNIQTAGTFKVGSYSSQPVACSASYKGMFVMNSADNLCLCNGTSWVGVGTGGTACAW